MWPESYYSTLLRECARYSNVTRARIQFPTLKIREHRFNRHTVQTSHYFVAVNVMKPVEQYCRCLVSGHLCGKADTQRWYKGGASTPLRSFTLGSLLLKDEVPVLDFHAYQQVGQQTYMWHVYRISIILRVISLFSLALFALASADPEPQFGGRFGIPSIGGPLQLRWM